MFARAPDDETVGQVWRLCHHLLGDTVAARRAAREALTSDSDSVATVLAACRGARRPSRTAAGKALLALPPADAEVVALHLVEGLPVAVIAAAIGVPRQVAASRLSAGLARLGDAVASARLVATTPPPADLVPIRGRRVRASAAAALLAVGLASALHVTPPAPISQPTRIVTSVPAPERTSYGLDLGTPPTVAGDSSDAIDIQAWVFEGTADQFAAAGIDCGAARQVMSMAALNRLQRDAAGRALAMDTMPITQTSAGGRVYLGSWRNISFTHGDRPDLPARPAHLGALIDGHLAAAGEAVAVLDLAAQQARLIGLEAPAGARIDVDRLSVAVLHRRGSTGQISLRPDQILVLPLSQELQHPPRTTAPARLEDESTIAPRQLVADRRDVAGERAVLVLKAMQRALYEDGEAAIAPSSLSRR